MLWIYLCLGASAGLLSGLFGIGGGLLIVPVLVFTFSWYFPVNLAIHMAMGTSLATIIITASNSTYGHHKNGGVDWSIVRQLSSWMILGTVVGSLLAHWMNGQLLEFLFGIYLVLISLKMLFTRQCVSDRSMPPKWVTALVGGFVGFKSALFGVGGGSVSVPFLTYCGHPMKRAAGISAACSLPVAVTGAIAYAVSGWHQQGLPPWSLGYIYLPAWLGIILTSSFCARLGARLSHRWPQLLLKRLFAILLMAIAVKIFAA